MKIGEIMAADREITLNEGKKTVTVTVANKGDRPVQVGSHFHFFEVNKCLSFDREKAYGYHLSNGENVSPEEIENKLALNPLIGEVIVTGEDNGLTARIYPEQAVVEAKALDAEAIQAQLQAFLDEYNRNQPTYRRITGLVVRKNPFIRNTTKKIRRQDVLIDEPLE